MSAEATGVIVANGHRLAALAVRRALLRWGQHHARPFPWRLTDDPYRLLMAEVMLHRTQAIQVVPVYVGFIARYPALVALADASRDELDTLLFPLGLRWRVGLLHAMVGILMREHGGRVPERKEELLALPGVSDYIASAVRCFSRNLPEALIDTNTVRVVGRLFGLEIKESSRRNRQFRELIAALVDPEHARAYNYALLDLANKLCTKREPPSCHRCPLSAYCAYGTLAIARAMAGAGGSPSQSTT